jgi:hypothetical protein
MAIPTEMSENAEDGDEGGGEENPFQAGVQKASGRSNAVKVGGGSGGVRKR